MNKRTESIDMPEVIVEYLDRDEKRKTARIHPIADKFIDPIMKTKGCVKIIAIKKAR